VRRLKIIAYQLCCPVPRLLARTHSREVTRVISETEALHLNEAIDYNTIQYKSKPYTLCLKKMVPLLFLQ